MSKFLSTEINILDFKSDNVQLYIVMLVVYMLIIIFQHYLDTNTHQMHRESLTQLPQDRFMCKILLFNVMRTVVYIINVIYIASNNLGVLFVAVVGHMLGVYLVYRHQRPDYKHPVHSLLRAMKSPKNDAIKKDIRELLTIFRNTTTKF